MISRVAEHCYWLSRYLERLENTARVLEVNQTLLLDFEVPYEQQWKPILIISGIHDYPGPFDAETVQTHMTWERENPSSIVSSLANARENARIIRETISADMWERMNFYYLWIETPEARHLYDTNRTEFYGQIKRINQLLHGISEATMSHDEPWEFFQFGRYVERASQTARILDVKYHLLLPTPEHIGTPVDNAHWVAILKSCSGYEMFHRQHTGLSHSVNVGGFLILDRVFPRSVRFCLNSCRVAAHRVTGRRGNQPPSNEVEVQLDGLIDWLNLVTIEDLVRAGLHESLTILINRIHDLGEAVFRTFFDFRIESQKPMTQKQEQFQTSA